MTSSSNIQQYLILLRKGIKEYKRRIHISKASIKTPGQLELKLFSSNQRHSDCLNGIAAWLNQQPASFRRYLSYKRPFAISRQHYSSISSSSDRESNASGLISSIAQTVEYELSRIKTEVPHTAGKT